MKKIIAILLSTFVMIFSLPVFAQDAPEIVIDENVYDAIDDSFCVSGKILNEIGNAPVALKITYKGKTADEIVYLANSVAQKSGNDICFSFEPLKLPVSAKGGTYEICVTGEYGGKSISEYAYSGIDDFSEILKNINNATTQSELFNDNALGKTNADKLSVDYEALEKLTDKTYFSTLLLAESYEIPENLETDADAQKIKEALLKFRADYKRCICMAGFFNIKSVADSKNWFDVYSEYCGFSQTSDIYSYLESANSEKFISRIKTDKSIDTLSELKTHIEKLLLLTSVETGDQTTVKNIITKFSSYFTGFSSDYAKYSGSINNALAGKHFDTCEALVAEANRLAAEKKKSGSGGSTSGGSSGGSSWGGSAGGVSIGDGAVSDNNKPAVEPSEKFKDMNNAVWAKTAVYYLCDKGIVSGKTSDSFQPNENITRAEFAKLIVMASGKTESADENIFSDIKADDWFAPYVNLAHKLGIVNGDENGAFNPNEPITRQDMAVMIFRLMGEPNENSDLSAFSDKDEIGEYAKTAVAVLHEKGIINGMGDGSFSPFGFATRAQAAQILYNMLRN